MNVLLSLLLLVAPVKLEHGQFTILKDGQKIGTEDFSIARRGTGYLVEGKMTIGDVVKSSRMELDANLVATSYEASNRAGTIRVKITSPVSELQSIVNGETSSADFRFPEGGAILDNDFFHHYLILMYRVAAGQNSYRVCASGDEKRDGDSSPDRCRHVRSRGGRGTAKSHDRCRWQIDKACGSFGECRRAAVRDVIR